VVIMRAGKVVQMGSPEELVARPADDYVADFVRDIPRSHVLTLRWVMRDPRPEDPADGPEFPSTTVIRNAIHAAAGTNRPIRVVDDGRLVGVVDRLTILETVAGAEDPNDVDAADLQAALRDSDAKVGPIQEPFEGTAALLAEAAVDPGRTNRPQPPAPEP
jgi:glycine betaine/proline transport system ATP-binding protein